MATYTLFLHEGVGRPNGHQDKESDVLFSVYGRLLVLAGQKDKSVF